MAVSQDQIAAIWAKMLGISQVGPEDNFFAIGGHSLLGVKLIAAVQEKLPPDIELTLSDLFEFPTLAAFTEHLASLTAPSEETGSI
jgi:acyl carrier protein